MGSAKRGKLEHSAGMVHSHATGRDDLTSLISESEHQRVVAHCVDVPGECPSFALALTGVGIAGKTVWVQLPQGRLAFDAHFEVDLPAHIRGIHMSRMEEAVTELYHREFVDLREYAEEIGRLLILRQEASRCVVMLSGTLPVLRHTAVSGRESVDAVEIDIRVDLQRAGDKVTPHTTLGAGMHHITACPCTQKYNQALFLQEAGPCPLPTHSQRSMTWLRIGTVENKPSWQDLFACLEAALHVTSDLLKRQDEAEIVLKSHRYPQFAEDAVRETAREAVRRLGGILPPETTLLIESKSLESIHIHDVVCRLETTLAKLAAL